MTPHQTAVWLILLSTAPLLAPAQESPLPPADPPPAEAAPVEAPAENLGTQVTDFLKSGKVLVNLRPRYEFADQDGSKESHAFTFRTRLGYETAPLYGFQGLVEFEDVRILGNEDNFNQVGLSGRERTVVADVEATELNQAWLSFERFHTLIRGGRQRITLDNHRFIGNVGWRQNEQTFDAVTVANSSLPDTTLFYGYLWDVNRIFGDDSDLAPRFRDFESSSHLFNAAYRGCPYGTVSGYAYLLDFDNSPLNSSDTFGVSFAGSAPLTEELTANYRAQYAYQQDSGDNPVNYDADYYNLELGATYQRWNAGAGYEVLGSGGNGRVSFSTPLATLHAFNGWADLFLTTPPNGLQDIYGWVGATLLYEIPVKVVYHEFSSDTGKDDYGREVDIVVSKKFLKNWTALAKYAYYDGEVRYPDTQRLWLQLEFAF